MQAPLDIHHTGPALQISYGGVRSSHGLLQASSRLCRMVVCTRALGDVLLRVLLSVRQYLDSEPVGGRRGHEQHMLREAPGMTPWTPTPHRPGSPEPLGGPELAACELFVNLHPQRVHGGSTPRLC